MCSTGPVLRKLTILDAMVLIAVIAAGLALIGYSQLRYFVWEPPIAPDRLVYHTLHMIGRFVHGALPIHYGLCLVVVAKDLLSERPFRDALSRRPGLAACFTTLATALLALVVRALAYGVGQTPGVIWSDEPLALLHATAYMAFCSPEAVDTFFISAGPAAMAGVLSVWLVQLLCGLWMPAPDWTDRLGRALGATLLLWMFTPH
jgi:hypothetical protein